MVNISFDTDRIVVCVTYLLNSTEAYKCHKITTYMSYSTKIIFGHIDMFLKKFRKIISRYVYITGHLDKMHIFLSIRSMFVMKV